MKSSTRPDPWLPPKSAFGTSLRYDGTGQQFIQNWKTPPGAGTCYRVTLTLIDDTTQTALSN